MREIIDPPCEEQRDLSWLDDFYEYCAENLGREYLEDYRFMKNNEREGGVT